MNRDAISQTTKNQPPTINQDSLLNREKLNYIEKIRSKTEGAPVVLGNVLYSEYLLS